MSKRDQLKKGALKPTNVQQEQNDEVLFSGGSVADMWSDMPDTPARDFTDDVYGNPRASADELEVQLQNAIVPDGQDLVWGRWRLSPVGLVAPDDVTGDEYQQIGEVLLTLDSRLQWLIGDWVVYGDQWEYGETYKTLAEQFGYEVATLHNYASVCRRVHFSLRNENLTYGHHNVVAAMTPEEQQYWLNLASIGDKGQRWSIKRLTEAIKGAGQEQTRVSKIPAWQKPISVVHEQYVDRWEDFKPDQRRLIYESLKSAVERMEVMGIDG